MTPGYIRDQTFDKRDFSQKPLDKGDYENCVFTNCNFANTDLFGVRFIECECRGCNFSTTVLARTSLQDVQFTDCKMLGLHFEDCHEFGFAVGFKDCQLDHSSFYGMKLAKTKFAGSKLWEADFTGATLNQAVFDHCDLLNATFDNTNLEQADLRSAFNYTIDPEKNRIKGAKFALPAVTGLLAKYDIVIDANS